MPVSLQSSLYYHFIAIGIVILSWQEGASSGMKA